MGNYIDILLTKDGYFCVAPPWVVKAGDLIGLPDAVSGESKVIEVIAVATDEVEGDHIKLIEKYTGYPLPKITAKYHRNEVEWDEPVQE